MQGRCVIPWPSWQVMATPKNIIGAPKGSVAAQRNVKKKMARANAVQKKQKGGGGMGCAVM